MLWVFNLKIMGKNKAKTPGKYSRGAELEAFLAVFQPLSAGQRVFLTRDLSFQPEISVFFTFFANFVFFSKKT